ncbi:MAG: type IV secretory system conjugative DNA transfer family protein [Rickettsiales bacterium]
MENITPKLFNPPRGSWDDTAQAQAPLAKWLNPTNLQKPEWKEGAGKIILGRNEQGQNVAYGDDRHLVTIAGSRAGKTATMLIPNLRRYAGSVLVIDPKGELAEKTSIARFNMEQDIYILDPFRVVEKGGRLRKQTDSQQLPIKDKSAYFNPLDELRLMKNEPDLLLGEAAALADSLIISEEKQPHWGDAARKLVQAVVLYLLTDKSQHPATLKTVVDFFASPAIQKEVYEAMTTIEDYDGFLQQVASTNLARMNANSNEYASIISTGDTQLSPLGDMWRRESASRRSDFLLSDLKRRPMTIYLVLPASRMGTHARWLRMVITLALAAFEREAALDRDDEHDNQSPKYPVLFVLEEFAALGYMRPIERAAGFIASYGVKLWTVLQDLQQLKTHYRDSWQTFLGNAGMVQIFGLNDGTTEEFISQRLGTTQYEDEEPIIHRSFQSRDLIIPKTRRIGCLLEPHEVRIYFSRETGRQIIIFPHLPPIALFRMPYDS